MEGQDLPVLTLAPCIGTEGVPAINQVGQPGGIMMTEYCSSLYHEQAGNTFILDSVKDEDFLRNVTVLRVNIS